MAEEPDKRAVPGQCCEANDFAGQKVGIIALVFAHARDILRFDVERSTALAVDSGSLGHGRRVRRECEEMRPGALLRDRAPLPARFDLCGTFDNRPGAASPGLSDSSQAVPRRNVSEPPDPGRPQGLRLRSQLV